MDLLTATKKWKEAQAESRRRYEIVLDRWTELSMCHSPYAKAEATMAYRRALADYDEARVETIELGQRMRELKAGLGGIH